MTKWRAISFPINATEEYKKFKKRFNSPKDCVINAFQVMGIVNEITADIMRIMVGHEGLQEYQIEGIFDYLRSGKTHKFVEYQSQTEIETILSKMKWKEFPTILFAGVKYKSGARHVFIIERSNMDGSFKIIDPHSEKGVIECGDTTKDFVDKCLNNVQSLYLLSEKVNQRRR
jgi:hypothetical protein